MTRPWRLTRRQRVEMEAALAEIRKDVTSIRSLVIRLRALEVDALTGGGGVRADGRGPQRRTLRYSMRRRDGVVTWPVLGRRW